MMELEAAYPVVVTEKLAECRDFYIRRLGFQVARGRVLGPVHAVSGGVRLSVQERGDGPPLLLVAGIPAVASDWEPVVRRLSARRRTIAYDNRGSGASTVTPGPYTIAQLAADAVTVLDRLDIDRADVFGMFSRSSRRPQAHGRCTAASSAA